MLKNENLYKLYFLSFATISSGQQTNEDYHILFKNGKEQLSENFQGWTQHPDIQAHEIIEGRYFRLIQLRSLFVTVEYG